MQRILKYPLLLKDILKHTASSHSEAASLSLALRAVQDAAKYVNETKYAVL